MEVMNNLTVFLVLVCILSVPTISFLLTLQKIGKLVSAKNRKFNPYMVWLLLVPFIGSIWPFKMVKLLSQSVEEELKDRNIPVKPKPMYHMGLALAVLGLLVYIPPFRWFALYLLIIFFVLYWHKAIVYKRLLAGRANAIDGAV